MKTKGFILFALISSLLILSVSLIIIFAAVSNEPEPIVFAEYRYEEYIDRSIDKTFVRAAGAQLYEAENSVLSRDVEIADNAIASGGKEIRLSSGKSLKYTITADENCNAQLKLSVCYLSDVFYDTVADNLLSVRLNGVEASVKDATVRHSYNWLDFIENVLCSLEIKSGENVIEVESTSADFSVDYFLLTPDVDRTVVEKTIGIYTTSFDSEREKQKIEPERGTRGGGAVAVFEKGVSSGYYTKCSALNSFIVTHIESKEAVATEMTVAIKNNSSNKVAEKAFEISVNGEVKHFVATMPDKTDELVFSEIAVGSVTLKKGVNDVEIRNVGGDYCVDYLTLNNNINYSSARDVLRYEAEDALLLGDCRSEYMETASANRNVGYVTVGSSVTFIINSKVVGEPYLSIGMSYFGDATRLSDVIEVTVNGALADISAIPVHHTGGYENYIDVLIGKIVVARGKTEIIVRCVSVNYNLDYITLSHAEYTSRIGFGRYKAEEAVFYGGSQEESNGADGGKNVGFNTIGSGIEFVVVSDADVELLLSISLSTSAKDDYYMSDCFTLRVNGQSVNIYGVTFKGTGDWKIYALCEASSVFLQKGINEISVISKAEVYNVDYITLAAK